MEYKYQELKINYLKVGEGKPIILLHGWCQNLNTFEGLIDVLKTKYTVYAIDLPGFGFSDEPEDPWSVKDYSNFLDKFCTDLKIHRPIILGHSFGGRIAIKYASNNSKIRRLILVDSAGLNINRGIKFYFRKWRYKLVKNYYKLIKNNVKLEEWFNKHASNDYKQATEKMRLTLKKVVNEDLRKDLRKIKAETLLIWGENDTVTPLKIAFKMQKKIPNAGLVRLEGLGHFPYLEDAKWFHIIIKNYLDIK